MVAPVMLTAEEVAERVGTIVPETWRRYVYGGRAPAPDDYVGRTPRWRASTVTQWIKERPGRGAGGGRRPAPGSDAAMHLPVPGQMTTDEVPA